MASSLRPKDSDPSSVSRHDHQAPSETGGEPTGGASSVKIVAGGVTWHVRPGWEWLVYGQSAPNWLHLVAEPQAEPVKRNVAREVWRVTSQGQVFFAKLYREAGLIGKVRALFRGHGSELEWQAGDYARRFGIDTVEPVAYGLVGRLGWAGPSILITRALPEAISLYEYWVAHVLEAGPRGRYRNACAVIESAAGTLAHAHQYGFHHRDLHAANLLAAGGPDHPPRVVFVDLHNVRTQRRVPDGKAIRNLAQLGQWFQRHATRTERLRFLRHYLAFREELSRRADSGPGINLPDRDIVAAVNRAAAVHAWTLWAKRDRRAMRDGKYFCRLRIRGGWRGHAFLQAKHPVAGSRASQMTFTRRQWHEWLANPLDLVRFDRKGLIKDSHTAYVCRAQLPTDGGPLEVVCKRAKPRTWLKKLYYMLSRSRNRRNWRRGYQLLNRDLPTARPLAALERRFAGLLVDSVILTEAVPGARDFDALLRMDLLHEDPHVVRRAKLQAIEALARLIKEMQSKGFGHHDFKASNLMVQWDRHGGEPVRLSLVDLDGLVLRRRLSRRERLRPLVRLNVSFDEARLVTRTDRLRFLKAYLIGPGRSGDDWKAVWREIADKSETKRHHKEQRRQWKLKRYGRT